jgi:hypothetical protein
MGQWGPFDGGAGDRPGQCSYCTAPPKKRGRPTIREKALESNEDLLSTHLLKKPHHYKNTPLYHSEYGIGAAYEFYVHINEKPVWTVRCPKAPGGVQDFKVRQPEMERYVFPDGIQVRDLSSWGGQGSSPERVATS